MGQAKIPGIAENNPHPDNQPLSPGGNSADQQQRIRDRALEIARARGQKEGYAEPDWRMAESEILHITGGG